MSTQDRSEAEAGAPKPRRHPCDAANRPRQAVVLIHGIGEQRPMDTLRSFVDAVWNDKTGPELHERSRDTVWSKPDLTSGGFELRRLTTDYDHRCTRTDFFELYWAHLMEGTQLAHVRSWAGRMLLRWPWHVPRPLLAPFLVLWTIALTLLTFLALSWLPASWPGHVAWTVPSALLAVASFVWLILQEGLVKPVIGDAARYLSPSPANVKVRRAICSAGVDLLEKLHDAEIDGRPKYDRIIVVGHSLGSVIGYDVLTHLWHRHHQAFDPSTAPANEALTDLEWFTRQLAKPREARRADLDRGRAGSLPRNTEREGQIASYRNTQPLYRRALREAGSTWRITDFVTLGSPLTYADILLADGACDLFKRQERRELPTCPPMLEAPTARQTRKGEEAKHFSYQPPPDPDDAFADRRFLPHFAAAFAPVRWTNLYFPAPFVLWGDIIGGPLAGLFGDGIRDVELSLGWGVLFKSHLKYWLYPGDPMGPTSMPRHIDALSKAIDLDDQG